MHLYTGNWIAFVLAGLVAVASAIPGNRPPSHEGPWPPKVCDYTAKGPHLEAKQQAALADFARLYVVANDINTAFNRWIPGKYIQHNPNTGQGRQPAIDYLNGVYADGTVTNTHLTFFGGQGYGAIHFKSTRPKANVTYAILDYFRFEGTCIVEHWDVVQEITGKEPNPIAYF
ncbi:hypothetical protein CC1G_08239 [Coprinopsis cinerea okayama7|uniref:SnoaL-like domain-containing protein n=1 Tax=Coprinopsis cinerea (strain Okayama-7 / 130 / ATCC MYA-4618 / FGSC 9003) TaxID=240176 RepID=A8P7J1_COPC7|nr:hypothetical protein CC1G_08239 [Coprinopsis cinerea okayama7\|eukprot:XP_001839372.1 hypothetical protein CC1G_08239 [Coprinopsis cinerea okayama7\